MYLNPFAVVFWVLAGLIGYLITDTVRGALVSVVVAIVFSFLVTVLNRD